MKKVLFISCLVFFSLRSEAQITHIVSNLNDSGLGSLRDKVNLSNDGDIIRFNNSLIATGTATINLLSEITFSKELKFKGLYNSNDTLKISGGNTTRVFNIVNCGKTIIDSMIIINGNSSGNGGAILRLNCNDTLFILNSTITGNNAIYGGGIYSMLDNDSILTSNLYVENSLISENTASVNGGGVYFESSTDSSETSIIIELSNFIGNVALNGAGVYYQSLSASTSIFNINSSNILENTSTYNGGGVHCNFSNTSSLTISNSNVERNIASQNGGGINYASFYGYSPDSSYFSINIDNSTFSENESGNGGGLAYSSSSLFSYQSILTRIFNTTISDNNAVNGGGVYSSSTGESSDSLFLKNCTISGNTANNGGGFFSSAYSSTANRFFSISNSTIYANTAIDNGGAIYSNYQNSPSSITVKNSIIAENGSGVSGFYSFNNPTILSNSYNIFSNSISGIDVNDQIATALQLNLQPLSFNGGSTQTLLPGIGSVAINNGDPTDLSDAQNGVIFGVRDIGAAEQCHSASSIIVTACGSYSSPSGNTVYTVSGIYYDTIPNLVGCDSVITLDLTITNIDNTIIQNGFVITANETNADYKWVNCNNGYEVIVGETDLSYTAINNGSYAVVVSMNGCSDTSECITFSTIGIEKHNSEMSIKVYPNPTKGNIFFDFGEVYERTEIKIFDLSMREVYKIELKNQEGINLKLNIPNGIYFVNINSDGKQSRIKLIKK